MPLSVINFNYWFLQAMAMALTALIIPRLKITSIFGALLTVVAIAFMNANVWDAALFFKIPNTFTMQAGMLFLTNGVLFWILVKLLPGIEVRGILPALLAPVVFTVCSLVISEYGKDIDWLKLLDLAIEGLKKLRDYFQGAAPAPR